MKASLLPLIMLIPMLINNGPAMAEITLTREGKPNAVIAISEDSVEMASARELQLYLEKISGAVLPIVKKTPVQGEKNLIVIANNRRVEGFDINTLDLIAEGFKIVSTGQNLLFLGMDNEGTGFSVCHFLEKYCGVRWFMPGELGEVVPKLKTVVIDSISDTENPDFISRKYGGGDEEFSKWSKSNKLGEGAKISGIHAFGRIAPPEKYFQTHPEYYGLVNGERWAKGTEGMESWHGWQLCTTNQDVINLAIEYARKRFRENPSLTAVSINPNDAGHFCECERCQALDTGATDKAGNRVLTDRILTFTNVVADSLRHSHPDKSVLLLAYSYYRNPPKSVRPRDNVMIQYAYACALTANPMTRQRYHSMLSDWGKLSRNIIVYEYFMNWSWPQFPRPITSFLAVDIPFLKEHGVVGYYPQTTNDWASNGINYYLASKLLWDSRQDASGILDDYYDKFYGKAGPAIREYFCLFENMWEEVVASGLTRSLHRWRAEWLCRIYTPARLAECRHYLDLAENEAGSEKIRERVRLITEGLKHTELAMEMYRDLVALAGMNLCTLDYWGSIKDVQNPEKEIESAADALKKVKISTERFLRNADSLKDTNVISYKLLTRKTFLVIKENIETIDSLISQL